jgi:hypothetical protein
MSLKLAVSLAATSAAALLLAACFGGGGERASAPATASMSGSVAARLNRPLHFPQLAGTRCPASRGRYVATPTASGIALGSGPVRVFIDNAGELRGGMAHLASSRFPGWLALKTHFFSVPAYQGAFLVRAKSLDQSGPIALGATPRHAARLFVPSGPAANGLAGWREFPESTFFKAPGCYAWQVDGLTFSEIIVVRALPKLRA